MPFGGAPLPVERWVGAVPKAALHPTLRRVVAELSAAAHMGEHPRMPDGADRAVA